MSTFMRILNRSCAASSSLSGKRYFCTPKSYSVEKLEYSSTEVFLTKAKEHLATGDVAQCCEKLFGCAKFALRTYVDELGMLHSIKKVDSFQWDYAKYRKLCVLISKSFDNKNEMMAFMKDWSRAEQLHIVGWNLNSIEYDDAEIGIQVVEDFVQKIAKLPKNEERAIKFYKELFDFDEVFIAKKIS